MTVKVHSSDNPPLSVHVQETVLEPTPWKKDPEKGAHTDVVMVPSSVSTQVGEFHMAELPTLLARDGTTTGVGQVICGGVFNPNKNKDLMA